MVRGAQRRNPFPGVSRVDTVQSLKTLSVNHCRLNDQGPLMFDPKLPFRSRNLKQGEGAQHVMDKSSCVNMPAKELDSLQQGVGDAIHGKRVVTTNQGRQDFFNPRLGPAIPD